MLIFHKGYYVNLDNRKLLRHKQIKEISIAQNKNTFNVQRKACKGEKTYLCSKTKTVKQEDMGKRTVEIF